MGEQAQQERPDGSTDERQRFLSLDAKPETGVVAKIGAGLICFKSGQTNVYVGAPTFGEVSPSRNCFLTPEDKSFYTSPPRLAFPGR